MSPLLRDDTCQNPVRPAGTLDRRRLELRIEQIGVVGGEGPRADQADIAAHHLPELRQLIEAHAADDIADIGQDARIARQLAEALPFETRCLVALQIMLEKPLGVAMHGAKLQDAKGAIAEADPRLLVEGRPRAERLDQKRKHADQRGSAMSIAGTPMARSIARFISRFCGALMSRPTARLSVPGVCRTFAVLQEQNSRRIGDEPRRVRHACEVALVGAPR